MSKTQKDAAALQALQVAGTANYCHHMKKAAVAARQDHEAYLWDEAWAHCRDAAAAIRRAAKLEPIGMPRTRSG